ncbi:hypothetical protein yc1106_02896 [Curvularia clavata]|uniref:Uncharacterized protein n=1 Tax=Curvularia clavata TaxID=95742 RepID=A0A9Q9DQI2_CURCL|nr:hypothetical protein yc1106_02896 [Curvularia clavata]
MFSHQKILKALAGTLYNGIPGPDLQFRKDPVGLLVTGEIVYGPIIASDFPGLTGSKERTKYDISFSRGTDGFPSGTKILSTQSLGHNGTEELALWRSVT